MKRLSRNKVEWIYNASVLAYNEYAEYQKEVLSIRAGPVALRRARKLRERFVELQKQVAELSHDEEYNDWMTICRLQEL